MTERPGAFQCAPDRRDGCNGNEVIERLLSEPVLADSLAAAAIRKLFEEPQRYEIWSGGFIGLAELVANAGPWHE